jgi:hypothetical protein
MAMSVHQNPARNREVRLGLKATETNKNDIRDEVKRGLNSGNSCSYAIQNLLLLFHVPSKYWILKGIEL